MNEQTLSAVIEEQAKTRIYLEERLKRLSRPTFTRTTVLVFVGVVGICIALFGSWKWDYVKDSPIRLFYISVLITIYFLGVLGLNAFARGLMRASLERQLLFVGLATKSEDLQNRLEEDFFTNLVKINFKYIDQYYLQTQRQANKSFLLCSIAASISLLMILTGIALLFVDKTHTEPGYVAASAGLLGEFIAAVFFYLYNKTIIKMSEYHEKLVLTQNISLALKISEDLPHEQKAISQAKLVEYLSKDINSYLVGQYPLT